MFRTARLIIASAVALLVVAACAVVVALQYTAQTRQSVQDTLVQVAQAKRAQLQSYFLERLGDAAVVAGAPAVSEALRNAADPVLHAAAITRLQLMTRRVAQTYRYRNVGLIDRDGGTVFALREGAFDLPGDVLARALVSSEPQLVDFHRSGDCGMCVGVLTAVYADEAHSGEPLGALYMEIDAVTGLFPRVVQWPLASASAEGLLVRRDDEWVVFLSPLRFRPDVAPATQNWKLDAEAMTAVHALTAEQTAAFEGIDYRGEPVFAALAAIAGTPWSVLVKIDRQEATRPLRTLRSALLTGAGLLVLVAGALLWQLRQSQHQPAPLADLAARYFTARRASGDAYLAIDALARILDVNEAMEKLTGYTRAELLTMRIDEVLADSSRELLLRGMASLREAGGGRLRRRWRRKDGEIIDIELTVSYVGDAKDGSFLIFAHDIGTQLVAQRRIERLNHFNQFLKKVYAAIFTQASRDAILGKVCDLAVDSGSFVLAWAGVPNTVDGGVRAVATRGAAQTRAYRLDAPGEPPAGECELVWRAVAQRQAIACNDFQNDPQTAPWHDIARIHNIHAAIAIPVVIDGEIAATLSLYVRDKDYFDTELTGVLEEAGRAVALALQAAAKRTAT